MPTKLVILRDTRPHQSGVPARRWTGPLSTMKVGLFSFFPKRGFQALKSAALHVKGTAENATLEPNPSGGQQVCLRLDFCQSAGHGSCFDQARHASSAFKLLQLRPAFLDCHRVGNLIPTEACLPPDFAAKRAFVCHKQFATWLLTC